MCSPLSLLRRLLLAAGCAALAGTAVATVAEDYVWRNVPVQGGGYVSGLIFHPHEPDLFYARTDVGGAYRWDAARRVWLPLNDKLDRRQGELTGVLSFALDAADPNRLYLAGGSYLGDWAADAALLRSEDRGETWSLVALPFKLGGNQDGRGMGERLGVDPHDGRVLFLGTSQDGLWRSGDAGRTWSRAGNLPRDAHVALVVFAAASGTPGRPTPGLYLGLATLEGPSLYRSADGGRSWTAVPGQPAGVMPHHAAFDEQGRLHLTVGNGPGPNDVTAGGVWRYDPRAEAWEDLTPVRPGPEDRFGYAGLALDPRNPGTLLVSTLNRWTQGDEIFRSVDDGKTWAPLLARSTFDPAAAPYVRELKPHWISEVAIDPFNSSRVWFVTGYGVWTTGQVDAPEGADLVWSFANEGLEETVIDDLISPPEGAPLLSAMGDLGGFRHDDLAMSPPQGFFQPLHSGSPGIDFAAHMPAKVVRTHWGPARGALSLDGGATWRNFAATPAAAREHGPGIIAISADGRRLVWLPKGAKPHYSTDEGATWRESRARLVANTDWATYGPVADRVNAQRFYIYDRLRGDFYASADGGERFVRRGSLPVAGGLLRAEPGAEGNLWLPTREGLLHSTNAGRTFRKVPGVEVANQVGFGAPAAGRTRPSLYLDGTVGGRESFFRSDDGGATWVRIGDDRRRYGWIRCLTGDARVPGRLYLGTSGRGIILGEPAR